MKRIFEYKEVSDKKVKLVALKLQKYTSLWWTNLYAKRVRNRKEKIQKWEKVKAKLKARFVPSSYVQDSYVQLYNLTQGSMSMDEYTREFRKLLVGSMSMDEYTREFRKLLVKCDIHEPAEQTIIRHLGGIEPKYANAVEFQRFTTFDEVCVLTHKVEQQRRRKPFRHGYFNPP